MKYILLTGLILMFSVTYADESPCCIAEQQNQCASKITAHIKKLAASDKERSMQIQKMYNSQVYTPCDLLTIIEKDKR